MIWVERREHQPSNPCLHCRHLAGVAFGPRSCPHAHAGMSRLGQECFRSSVFKSRRRPSVRWHATVCVPGRGDPLCGPCMHSGRPVCIRMHQGMHTFFLPVSAWFQRSGDGPGACMHCMHHSLIEDSRKRKETPYIDAYNAYKRKEFFFSFIYKGFRAFSKPFLYASPDAYRCIHAYKTAGRTSQCRKVRACGSTASRTPGSPAKRIGGSLDVLPTPEAGGTLTAKRSGRASGVYAFRAACMHPYASGDAYVFSFRFGLFPTFRGWSGGVYALYASFPYRGFGKKEGNPIY